MVIRPQAPSNYNDSGKCGKFLFSTSKSTV